jgi:SAM-dependent methyltransferase
MTKDIWAAGAAYEAYMGHWSRQVGREFVAWLAVPPKARWVDVGCGAGALADTILRHADPKGVEGVDPSHGFIEYARARITDSRAHFSVGDARWLPQPNGVADSVVAGLALNFIPNAVLAVKEMRRVASPKKGVIAAYVWDYAEGMEMLRTFWKAATELDERARPLDERSRFPNCDPISLKKLFESAELTDVEVQAIEVTALFRNFDDYWTPFLGGQGPAPTYVASLTEGDRARLRERVRAALPTRPDSAIHLNARAWAVRGLRASP